MNRERRRKKNSRFVNATSAKTPFFTRLHKRFSRTKNGDARDSRLHRDTCDDQKTKREKRINEIDGGNFIQKPFYPFQVCSK